MSSKPGSINAYLLIFFFACPCGIAEPAPLDLNALIDEFAKDASPPPCELPIEDYATLSPSEFLNKYIKKRQPMLMKNMPPLMKDSASWSRSSFLSRFSDLKYPANSPLTEDGDLLMSIANITGESEGSKFFMQCDRGLYGDLLKGLHGDLSGEPHNLYGTVGNNAVLSIGGTRSWTRLHMHGNAWQAQIHGLKLWWMGDGDTKGFHPESALKENEFKFWGGNMCEYMNSRPAPITKYCVVSPGYAMYVPERYYHGTCNLSPWTLSFGAEGNFIAAQHRAIMFDDLEGFNDAVNMCKSASGKLSRADTDACKKGIVGEDGKAVHVAAAHGHVRMLEHLVANGANPGEVFGEEKKTPLSIAGRKGHLAVVKFLASGSESLRAWNETLTKQLKHRCLPTEIAEGGAVAVPVMEFLIGLRANPNQKCSDKSPMESVIQSFDGGLAMVKLLEGSGCKIEPGHLKGAADSQREGVAMTQYLVKALGSADIPDELDQPLHAASKRGHLKIVELLLDNRAKVNAVDSKGMQAIHHVVGSGLESLAKLLVEHGANLNAKSRRGKRPADIAQQLMKSTQADRSGDDNSNKLALLKTMYQYLSVNLSQRQEVQEEVEGDEDEEDEEDEDPEDPEGRVKKEEKKLDAAMEKADARAQKLHKEAAKDGASDEAKKAAAQAETDYREAANKYKAIMRKTEKRKKREKRSKRQKEEEEGRGRRKREGRGNGRSQKGEL